MGIRVEINEFYYGTKVVSHHMVYVSISCFIIDFVVGTYIYTLYCKRPPVPLSNLDVCLKTARW
jgi:hypothetical protein